MLNILIPSIPERSKQVTILLSKLKTQIDYCHKVHSTLGMVNVIVDDSKRFLLGGLSIGDIRNILLNQSKSKYICFLDDDDSISPDYVETLLRLCAEGKDICTFKSLFMCDGYWTVIEMGLGNENQQASPDITVMRNAWHICPVKRTLAIQHKFSNINHNEDWDWFSRVLEGVKTEAKSKRILHNYNHYVEISEADKIINENTIN